MDWLAVGIVLGVIALCGGIYLVGRRMPYPFEHEGRRYKRMPDGSFTDDTKQPVTAPALVPALQASFEKAKYGDDQSKDWGRNSD